MMTRLILCALAAALTASAQCAMCRTATSQSAPLAAGINKGILLLMLPAAALFLGVFAMALRKDREGSFR